MDATWAVGGSAEDRASRQNQQRTFEQFADFLGVAEELVLKAFSHNLVVHLVPGMIEQIVDGPKIVFQDGVRTRTFPVLHVVEVLVFSQDRVQQCFVEKNIGATVAKSVGEVRPLGIAKYSAATAVTAVDKTVTKCVIEARSPEIAKYRATIAAEAVDSTVAKSVDEARPPGIAKYRATKRVQQRQLADVPKFVFFKTESSDGLPSRSLILEPCRMLRSLSSKFSPVQGSTACGWTGRAGEGAFGLLVERHLEGGRVELAVEGAVTGPACGSQNPDVKADCWSAVSRRLILSVACRRSAGRRLSERFMCPSAKSCAAATDSR